MRRERIKYSSDVPRACVDFIVVDGHVVYCGMNDKNDLPNTTATDAPLIMKAIADRLDRPVNQLSFRELSTHRSWICPPGSYTFQRVGFVTDWVSGLQSVTWKNERRCPPVVIELFRDEIGGAGEPQSLEEEDRCRVQRHSEWRRPKGRRMASPAPVARRYSIP